MKLHDDPQRTVVRQWINKADADYRVAERLLRDVDPFRGIITFHCQQAVEKFLKGFLVTRGVEFPKTHDIEELLNLMAPVAPLLATSLGDAKELTPYGAETRYPGDSPDPLPGQEQTALVSLHASGSDPA